MGYNSGKIQIVLNRHSKRSALDDDRVEKALGRKIAVRVPNAYNEVIRAINAGAPIPSGKSDFGAAVQGWARALASNPGEKAMAQSHTSGVMSIFGR